MKSFLIKIFIGCVIASAVLIFIQIASTAYSENSHPAINLIKPS